MSKVLVVYKTKTGCTRGVAEKIAETISRSGAEVELLSVADKPDPAAYDAVVVGSGVRVGSWHRSAQEFVKANAETLKERPVAFFTVGLTLASEPEKTDEVRAFTDALIQESGVEPVDIGLFAGWWEPERFSFPERLVLKAMKAPQGDFRDFDAIEAWARGVAGKLGLSA